MKREVSEASPLCHLQAVQTETVRLRRSLTNAHRSQIEQEKDTCVVPMKQSPDRIQRRRGIGAASSSITGHEARGIRSVPALPPPTRANRDGSLTHQPPYTESLTNRARKGFLILSHGTKPRIAFSGAEGSGRPPV